VGRLRACPLKSGTMLWSVFHLAELFSQGVHRVAIVNKKQEFIGMLTQRDLVHLFARDQSLLGDIVHKTVRESNIYTPAQKVVSVNGSIPLWLTLATMREHNVTSVAVMDRETTDDGVKYKMVSAFTQSHCKGLHSKNFPLILEPTSKWLETVHHDSGVDPVETVPLNASISEVIDTLAKQPCHQLWVSDKKCEKGEKANFEGVISLTDVIQTVLRLG